MSSSAGEMELSWQGVEITQLNRILGWLEDGTLDFLLCTDPKLARCFDHPRIKHLPCPVAPDLVKPRAVEKRDGIGLFCPAKPSKNIFPQLLAVRLFQRRRPGFKLHTNLKAYARVIAMLGIDAEVYDWLPEERYRELLASLRVNLQVERCGDYFNYQVVEAGLLGVPSVVGPRSPLGLGVGDPEDPAEIADAMERAAEGGDPRGSIIKLAEENNKVVEEVAKWLRDTGRRG